MLQVVGDTTNATGQQHDLGALAGRPGKSILESVEVERDYLQLLTCSLLELRGNSASL
jgi:hypothetical protein